MTARELYQKAKLDFVTSTEVLGAEIHEIAVDHGWWPIEKTPEELVAESGLLGEVACAYRLVGLVLHARATAPRNEAEMIALHHSELSEALEEGARRGNPEAEDLPGFSAMEEQFADLLIRVLDHAHHKGYRLSEAVLAKIEVNRKRSYRHGGKVL